MKPGKKTACLCAAAVSIFWGLSFIGSKKAFAAGMDTFSLVMARFFVSTLALLAVSGLRRENLRVKKRDLPLLVVTALSGVTFYYFCELNGLKRLSASVASLIIATIPVLSALTGALLYKKKPSFLSGIGMALSLFGVYLVVFSGAGDNSASGFFFMLGACLCWIVYLEVTNRLLMRYSSLSVTFWQGLIALISVIPLAMTESVPWKNVPLDAWLWTCVFLGLICSALCYIMNNYSIAVLSPQTNSFFLNLSPVATAAGGYLLLGETVTLQQIVGGLLILGSLLLVSMADSPQKTRPSNLSSIKQEE